MILPGVPQPDPRRARRSGDRLDRRVAPRLHDRLLRRDADLLPRRRHRRARRERHGERPRGRRRPAALPVARLHPRGGPADRRPRRVVASARRAAERAGVRIVTGDTKVVGRGSGRQDLHQHLGHRRRAGRASISRRGTSGRATPSCSPGPSAITASRSSRSARGSSSRASIASDTAPLHELVAAMLDACPGDPRDARPDPRRPRRDPRRDRLAAAPRHRGRRARHPGARRRARRLRDPRPRPALRRQRGQARRLRAAETASDRVLAAMRAHPLGRDAQPHRPRDRGASRDASCCGRRSAATASSICRSREALPRIC